MPIFADESQPTAQHDKEAIRAQVSMATLVTYLGLQWDKEHKKVKCPRHKSGQERTPSAQVNATTLHCHACDGTWDIYELVMEVQHMTFGVAIKWIADNVANMPLVKPVSAQRAGADYLGAVDPEIVKFWIACLAEERREYLRNERLLTDKTIDLNGLGWRPEWAAYSLPFWRGVPLWSEVDIVQFRATQDTPWHDNGKRRWLGLAGHNRPSFIGRHAIGYRSVGLLFGTFDALLASQDGFSSISINGATTFLRDEEALDRLSRSLRARCVYIVPDKTPTEYPSAYRLAALLRNECRDVRVAHFPENSPGKDYTEYRQAGKTLLDFQREVLMHTSPFPSDNGDLKLIVDMLRAVADANLTHAMLTLHQLAEKNYMSQVVCHELQFQASFSPYPGLTHEQWDQMITQLESSLTWDKLATALAYWAKMAEKNQGAF